MVCRLQSTSLSSILREKAKMPVRAKIVSAVRSPGNIAGCRRCWAPLFIGGGQQHCAGGQYSAAHNYRMTRAECRRQACRITSEEAVRLVADLRENPLGLVWVYLMQQGPMHHRTLQRGRAAV